MEFGRENFRASDSEIFTESDSDTNSDEEIQQRKKRKLDYSKVVLPQGFLDPLPQSNVVPPSRPAIRSPRARRSSPPLPIPTQQPPVSGSKQFWKAGDYEIPPTSSLTTGGGALDRARVHPKFLHTNATSHKWALGAFAELLDNSVDEIPHGATYVKVDVLKNKKDSSKMLVIQDNGGGMNTATLRHCMSLGYSVKSKTANTIGQYGNGFKTSTMRLGADVIVFSRCKGIDGNTPTQSIGMLSYTFLTGTGKDDIFVPTLDYKKNGQENLWEPLMKSSVQDWSENLELLVQWSPYTSEADLLQQFNLMESQGTRVVIYNLWEDDQGLMELDFDADSDDIQLRGVNRDEAQIAMAKKYPSSRHFLTYKHSLRSYVSILYLRLSPKFRIVLRGKRVEHHKIVDDMMLAIHQNYKPTEGVGASKEVVPITVGFVKDAKEHIGVQGFNVYHKNRLIKPFWQVWHSTGSDGRGIIGVLEANFIEPAHDKQGFETTPLLERLRCKLMQIQRTYWRENSHEVGYLDRRSKTKRRTYSEILAEGISPNPTAAMGNKEGDKSNPKLAADQHNNKFPKPNVAEVRDNSLEATTVSRNKERGQSKANLAADRYSSKISMPKVTEVQDHSPEPPATFINKRRADMPWTQPVAADQHRSKIPKPMPKVTQVQENSPEPPASLSDKRYADMPQQPKPNVPEDRLKPKDGYPSQYAVLLAENNALKEKFTKLQESEKLRQTEMDDKMKEKDQKIQELEAEIEKAIALYCEKDQKIQELEAEREKATTLNREKDLKIQELEAEREKAIALSCEKDQKIHDLEAEREKVRALNCEKDQKIHELDDERNKAIALYCEDKIQRDIDETELKKKLKQAKADIYDLQKNLQEAKADIYDLQRRVRASTYIKRERY